MDLETQLDQLVKADILTPNGQKGSKFEKAWSSFAKQILEDPIENFIKSPLFCDIDLSPVQALLVKLTFNIELDKSAIHTIRVEDFKYKDEHGQRTFGLKEVQMNEYELFSHITLNKSYEEFREMNKKSQIQEIDLICGRRSGKSLLSILLSLIKGITKNYKEQLGKKTQASFLLVSHSKSFSSDVMKDLKSILEGSPILKHLLDEDESKTAATFFLKIPFMEKGKIVYSRIQILTNAADDKCGIGLATCLAIVDEIGTYNSDPNLKISDNDILQALMPSMTQFGEEGLLFKPSSPRQKSGVLYEDMIRWNSSSSPIPGTLLLKVPSWTMNSEKFVGIAYLRKAYNKDENFFDREYRGNFCDAASAFFHQEVLEKAISHRDEPIQKRDNSYSFYAAIDVAEKHDYYTLQIVGVRNDYDTLSKEEREGIKKYRHFVCLGERGKDTEEGVLDLKEVSKRYCNILKHFGITKVSSDQYHYGSIKHMYRDEGIILEQFVFSQKSKVFIYNNFKSLVNSYEVEIINHRILVSELKMLEQIVNGNKISIGHPSAGAIGDDHSDALALALYEAVNDQSGGMISSNEGGSYADFGDDEFTIGKRDMITGKLSIAPGPNEFIKLANRPEDLENEGQGNSFLTQSIQQYGKQMIVGYFDWTYNLKDPEDLAEFKNDYPEIAHMYELEHMTTPQQLSKAMVKERDGKLRQHIEKDYPNVNFSTLNSIGDEYNGFLL